MKMKKLITLLVLVTFIFSCDKTAPLPPNTFEITGSAEGIYNGMRAYIRVPGERGREFTTDTAIVMNETFSFMGKINSASMRTLTINGVKGGLSFVMEPGKINMKIYKDSIASSVVDGSENNEIYSIYKIENQKKLQALKEINLESREAKKLEDRTLYNELLVKTNEMNEALRYFTHDFVEKHSDSDFSLILLESMTKGRKPELKHFIGNRAAVNEIAAKNDANKALAAKIDAFIYRLESQKNLEVGKIAPNFSSFTPDGTQLTLNDIKGKATIIDFWASWCKPCRIENPNVVKVYNEYHDKGLEIISISLDRDGQKDRWLKAIEDDYMSWHHVSSLQFWNDPVAKLYNVTSIPSTFILDSDGRIVAKKLRGDALGKQIAALLD